MHLSALEIFWKFLFDILYGLWYPLNIRSLIINTEVIVNPDRKKHYRGYWVGKVTGENFGANKRRASKMAKERGCSYLLLVPADGSGKESKIVWDNKKP